ncbi:MAG: hypothetical protein J4432_05415 [DPANN group archaeon]|nr:hypothetical protein [DPANN group archaeon]
MKSKAMLILLLIASLAVAQALDFGIKDFTYELNEPRQEIELTVTVQNNAAQQRFFKITVDSELGSQTKNLANVDQKSERNFRFVFNIANRDIRVLNFVASVEYNGQVDVRNIGLSFEPMEDAQDGNGEFPKLSENLFVYLMGILIFLIFLIMYLPSIINRTPFVGKKQLKDFLKEEDVDRFMR